MENERVWMAKWSEKWRVEEGWFIPRKRL